MRRKPTTPVLRMPILAASWFAVLTIFAGSRVAALEIIFDYSFDTNNFFDPAFPERRAALEIAGQYYARFADNLTRIEPAASTGVHEIDPETYTGPFEIWSARFFAPGTGADTFVGGLIVPEDSVIIYAGGRNIDNGATLGRGGSGTHFTFVVEPWQTTLKARGQGTLSDVQGATAIDFAPWGGSIAFDTDNGGQPRDWYFGLDRNPGFGQNDFMTVALHELGHLLGFSGNISSFANKLNGLTFTGATATALNGGNPVPMNDSSHFQNDLTSPPGVPGAPEVVMDARLVVTNGITETKRVTELDYAAFIDIGWELAPLGDTNWDLAVNITDLSRLATSFGKTGGAKWKDGDFNHDGNVNITDLSILATRFGTVAAPIGAGGGDVPEPVTLALMSLAMAGLARRRSTRTS